MQAMPIVNLTEPLNILIALIIYVLVIYLSKEMKKSVFVCVMLLVFLTLISAHAVEYAMSQTATTQVLMTIANCIAVDFIFIFLSFIGYLWIDSLEAKEKKTKSLDNSLDWFWKKV